MKVEYEVTKKGEAYEVHKKCSDVPTLDDGTPDVKEYLQCFKIIQNRADDIVSGTEERLPSKQNS